MYMDPNQPATPAEGQAPAVPENSGQPATPQPVISTKDIEGKSPDEIVKFVSQKAEELGQTKAQAEQLAEFYKSVAPYVETINNDPDLFKVVEEKHQKRLNPTAPVNNGQPTVDQPKRDDTRIALEGQLIKDFETNRGIANLPEDTRKKLNVQIGQEIKEMLDPEGKKNFADVMTSIPLDKLQGYLDKGFILAKQKVELPPDPGQAGILGSFASSGGVADSATLSPEEIEIANKMGITPDAYLKNKKEIIERDSKRK